MSSAEADVRAAPALPFSLSELEPIQIKLATARQIRLDRKWRGHIHAEEDSQIAESANLFRFCFSELDSRTRGGSAGNVEIENSDIANLVALSHALG